MKFSNRNCQDKYLQNRITPPRCRLHWPNNKESKEERKKQQKLLKTYPTCTIFSLLQLLLHKKNLSSSKHKRDPKFRTKGEENGVCPMIFGCLIRIGSLMMITIRDFNWVLPIQGEETKET